MIDICRREGIEKDQVILHSDNGSPMKGVTMPATLQELGVIPSLDWPFAPFFIAPATRSKAHFKALN